MKRICLKLVVAAVLVVSAMLARKAIANSSGFSFIMNLRYVDGEKNKVLHTLDAGDLTLSGKVWAISKRARTTPEPESIAITVYKTGILNSEVCSVSVTPSKVLNDKVSFSKSCGQVESGTYCVKVSKGKALDDTGDGWQLQGAGNLTTK
jgi:hypothetical protein